MLASGLEHGTSIEHFARELRLSGRILRRHLDVLGFKRCGHESGGTLCEQGEKTVRGIRITGVEPVLYPRMMEHL